MSDIYTLGTKPAPAWCRDKITPFRRMDGSIGYEFYGAFRTYDLEAGDRLELDGKRFSYIGKEGGRNGAAECEDVSDEAEET